MQCPVTYVLCDHSLSLQVWQVWRRLDPAGFECMYSLEIKVEEYSYPALASDGLALVNLPILDHVACHSWNHEAAHFRPVDSDYQVYIRVSEYTWQE